VVAQAASTDLRVDQADVDTETIRHLLYAQHGQPTIDLQHHMAPKFLRNGPADAATTLVLAHGAGAAMDSPFMEAMATGLAARGIRVVRFEFPYMAERRQTGKQRPPDREPVLRATWMEVIGPLKAKRPFIGGKSMGGRIASLVADESGVAGLVCLGYPFHPAGKPDRLRIEHLKAIRTPTLIVQGTRDPFGNRDEVAGYRLSPAVRLHWLEDGDHSFEPRKASGRTHEQNLAEAVATVGTFVQSSRAPSKT
jgi:predicted alpha/beta-hydrolase family hydrolase